MSMTYNEHAAVRRLLSKLIRQVTLITTIAYKKSIHRVFENQRILQSLSRKIWKIKKNTYIILFRTNVFLLLASSICISKWFFFFVHTKHNKLFFYVFEFFLEVFETNTETYVCGLRVQTVYHPYYRYFNELRQSKYNLRWKTCIS